MFRANLFGSMILAANLSGVGFAKSGYKYFDLTKTTSEIDLVVKADRIGCTPIDIWNQQDLSLKIPDIAPTLPLTANAILSLRDGDCEALRDTLLKAASASNERLRVKLHVLVQEKYAWGIHSEGSDNERPYCEHSLSQWIRLDGHPLFPGYEFQASAALALRPASYAECVVLR